MVSYQSKRNKNTVVLSTMHDEGVIDASTRKRKPEMVLFYNETKGSVDAMDKLAHSYTTKRKTQRWPMVMFANVLDLATGRLLSLRHHAKNNRLLPSST